VLGVLLHGGATFWAELSRARWRTLYGSCDMRGDPLRQADLESRPVAGDERVCLEISGSDPSAIAIEEARHLCHHAWAAGSACDRSAALGACTTSVFTYWYYPSRTLRSADDVGKACASGGMRVGQP
jgi:hypothetical protein